MHLGYLHLLTMSEIHTMVYFRISGHDRNFVLKIFGNKINLNLLTNTLHAKKSMDKRVE